MKDDTAPEILPPEESSLWRQAYLETFVDTSSSYYQDRIASTHKFCDGTHYKGYLWECLRSASRITVQRLRLEIVQHPEVFVMADDHSGDGLPGRRLWPFAPCSIARFHPITVLSTIESLPQDLYIFDASLGWTLVFTHEYSHKRDLCLAVGIPLDAL